MGTFTPSVLCHARHTRQKSAVGGFGLEKTATRFPAHPLHFFVRSAVNPA